MQELLPSYINNISHRYLEVDDKILVSLILYEYPKYIDFIEFMDNIPKNLDFEFSLYVKKKNTKEILKDINYNISLMNSEIKTANKNQIDIEIIKKANEDSKTIRHEIQINNEEIYYIYSYFTIYFKNTYSKEQIFSFIKSFESKLYAKNILVNIANFRQLPTFVATLPISKLETTLLNSKYKIFTTSNLAYVFPFYTNNVFDKDGIIFGNNIDNNKINEINIFDNHYLNANMCVFGSSGSGKSYFIKLSIIRQYFMNKNQFIFDPEGEYVKIAKGLGQTVIDFYKGCTNRYNIMEFWRFEIYDKSNDFLDRKINNIIEFLKLFFEISYKQKEILYECIRISYHIKKITNDIESVYVQEKNVIDISKRIKSGQDIPTLTDVYNIIIEKSKSLKKVNKELSNLKNNIKKYMLDELSFLCDTNNVNISKRIIVFNISKLNYQLNSKILSYFLKMIEEKLKYEKESNYKNDKKYNIIYIDEVWKYISNNKVNGLSEQIFLLYKTIRKLNASIITITQDISDFFEFNNGAYGKSILNNSAFRLYFKMNYSDINILKRIGIMEEKEEMQIYKLNKGQVNIFFNSNNLVLNIKANKFEKKIMEEENNEFNNCS